MTIKKCEIRNNPGTSNYFGGYRGYGRYQWNIKYYGFQDSREVEAALLWSFGEYDYKLSQFQGINEVIGRPVKAWIDGRSGGWLVIDEELSKEELQRMDLHVSACLEGLSQFLQEEREYLK